MNPSGVSKSSAREVMKDLALIANPEKALLLGRFFKTGKGQYGEGDVFLGVMVPGQRKVAKKYGGLPLKDIERLLASRVHEHRLVALFILIDTYKKADEEGKEDIYQFYLDRTERINNWDLVDLSSARIVGEHLLDRDRSVLYKLAKSDMLWERRIAVISTSAFIARKQYTDALAISELLIKDRHDLLHKAVGWMLREIGKRDRAVLKKFLNKHCRTMPRTMLRYAIEKFDDETRKSYLLKK